jgi:hypothetical protein
MSCSTGSVTDSGMTRILDCRRGSDFGLEQRNVERPFDAGNRVVDILAKSLWTIGGSRDNCPARHGG